MMMPPPPPPHHCHFKRSPPSSFSFSFSSTTMVVVLLLLLCSLVPVSYGAIISNPKEQCPFSTFMNIETVKQRFYHPSTGSGGFFDFTATCFGSSGTSSGSGSSIPTFDFQSVLQVNMKQATTLEECGTIGILECCHIIPSDEDDDTDTCTIGSSYSMCSKLGISPVTPLDVSCDSDSGGGILYLSARTDTLLLPDIAGYSYFLVGNTRAIPQIESPTIVRLSSDTNLIQVYIVSSYEFIQTTQNCPGFCYDAETTTTNSTGPEFPTFPTIMTECFDNFFPNIPDVCKPPTPAPTVSPSLVPSSSPTITSQPTFTAFDSCPNDRDSSNNDDETMDQSIISQSMYQRPIQQEDGTIVSPSLFTFFAICIGGIGNGTPDINSPNVVTYSQSSPFACGDIGVGQCCLVEEEVEDEFEQPPSCDGMSLALCSRIRMTPSIPLTMTCPQGGILQIVANVPELVLSNTNEYSYFLSDANQAQLLLDNDNEMIEIEDGSILVTSNSSTISVVVADGTNFLNVSRNCNICYEDRFIYPQTMTTCLQTIKPPQLIPEQCRIITTSPSDVPSMVPSTIPSISPTTSQPTIPPPTVTPSVVPTIAPFTYSPTRNPVTELPSILPSMIPTNLPSIVPSPYPTKQPVITNAPSYTPTWPDTDPPVATCPTTTIVSSSSLTTMDDSTTMTTSSSFVSQRMYHPTGGTSGGLFDFFALCIGSSEAIPELNLTNTGDNDDDPVIVNSTTTGGGGLSFTTPSSSSSTMIDFKQRTNIADCGNVAAMQCCVVRPNPSPPIHCQGSSFSLCSRFGLGPDRTLDVTCKEGGILQLLAQVDQLVLPISTGYYYFFNRDTVATERVRPMTEDDEEDQGTIPELVLTSASSTVSVFVATEQVFLDVTNACQYCYDTLKDQFPSSMGDCFEALSEASFVGGGGEEFPTFCGPPPSSSMTPTTTMDTPPQLPSMMPVPTVSPSTMADASPEPNPNNTTRAPTDPSSNESSGFHYYTHGSFFFLLLWQVVLVGGLLVL